MRSSMKPGLSARLPGLPGRLGFVVAVAAALLSVLVLKAPIPQFEDYHHLADSRTLLGIPHFWNVASNVPFLLIGLKGLALLRRHPPGASVAWTALFAASALVFFGSGYYHLNPQDASLVWDRLPIGVAFMGFFVALLAEHAVGEGKRMAQRALLPLIAFSVASIYWWRATGDLSLWVWVQIAPMVSLVLLLWLLPGQYTHRRYLAYALGCYLLAKAFELGDYELLDWSGGALSGHTLKHLAAAAGVYCFYGMLAKRASTP